MAHTFYVAGSFGNWRQVRSVIRHIESQNPNEKCLYDWTLNAEAAEAGRHFTSDEKEMIAKEEIRAASTCEVFYLILDEKCTGALIETGMALASPWVGLIEVFTNTAEQCDRAKNNIFLGSNSKVWVSELTPEEWME